MAAPIQLLVLDTSSLLRVRELFGKSHERTVLSGLSRLVAAHELIFPPEVLVELERGGGASPDTALLWARRIQNDAQARADLGTVKAVLAKVPDLIDADSPHEQADPYVLALAIDQKGLRLVPVTIVTEDRKDKPTKTSLATAAGLHHLSTIPIHALVRAQGWIK